MEVSVELFNAFNNPILTGLTATIDGSTFGRLTRTMDTARGSCVTERAIQWAVRVNR